MSALDASVEVESADGGSVSNCTKKKVSEKPWHLTWHHDQLFIWKCGKRLQIGGVSAGKVESIEPFEQHAVKVCFFKTGREGIFNTAICLFGQFKAFHCCLPIISAMPCGF